MKKSIVLISLALIITLSGFIYWKFYFTYSEGNRAGLLQKFSKKGTIFKTYEGEMILSSVESNTSIAIASEKFFFSVIDDRIAPKVNDLQGEFVVVHYTEKKGTLPWRGDSRYLVDSIKVVQKRGSNGGRFYY